MPGSAVDDRKVFTCDDRYNRGHLTVSPVRCSRIPNNTYGVALCSLKYGITGIIGDTPCIMEASPPVFAIVGLHALQVGRAIHQSLAGRHRRCALYNNIRPIFYVGYYTEVRSASASPPSPRPHSGFPAFPLSPLSCGAHYNVMTERAQRGVRAVTTSCPRHRRGTHSSVPESVSVRSATMSCSAYSRLSYDTAITRLLPSHGILASTPPLWAAT